MWVMKGSVAEETQGAPHVWWSGIKAEFEDELFVLRSSQRKKQQLLPKEPLILL